MEEIFKLYETKKEDGDIYQYRFSFPADAEDIEKLEQYFGRSLPGQYIDFLHHHDGGFICNSHWGGYIWETGDDDLPQSRSIYFLSAKEILENTDITESCKQVFDENDIEHSLVIPIANTPKSQTLLMNAEDQSPVFLYQPDSLWPLIELYPDLKSFLKDYIENEGYIESLF